MKNKLYCLAIFACLASTNIVAKELPVYDIVYTPNRVAEKQADTLANITVITQKEIEEKQFESVEEILNYLPGITIANNGGRGKVSSIFQRGTESDHTIVLVDGVRVVSTANGGANISAIPVSIIERIESIRGASSSIYGSDAIGGVIQIFTKKAKAGSGVNKAITLKRGTNDNRLLAGSLSARSDDNSKWASLNVSHEKTNGFNACSGDSTLFRGCFVEEPDKDGFENNAVSVNAGTQFAQGKGQADISVFKSVNHTEFDGNSFSGNDSDQQQENYAANIQYTLIPGTTFKISQQTGKDNSSNFFNGASAPFFNSRNSKTSLIMNQTVGKHSKVIIGADHLRESIDSSNVFALNERRTDSGFIVASFKPDEIVKIETSYRLDRNSVYGKNETAALAVQYQVADTTLNMSYKSAFHAPTLNDLFFPFSSNPNLNPEKSRSLDLTIKKDILNTKNELSLYRTNIDNLIANDAFFIPQNINEVVIKGFEVSSKMQLNNTNIGIEVSRVHADNRSTDTQLARRPGLSGSLSANHKINKLLIGTNINTQSHFNEPNGTRVGGFTTIDANMHYKISPKLAIGLKVSNLADKEYETADFFNQAGREGEVFIRYSE